MYAIDVTTVKWSFAQLCSRQPQLQMVVPPASITPSTSTPFSFAGGVTLEAIMALLVHMDARLGTLSNELCQVNTRVGHIAWQQAVMGGYKVASSPEASEDESDGSGSVDDVEDGDDGSPSDDEMSTWCTYPFVTRDKKGE